MFLLSIIIPVYNVQNHIQRCIESIINQMDERIQVIIINDGSTDKSIENIEYLCITHKNIEIYNKENGGLSSARNFGITKSKGQYLYFVIWVDAPLLFQRFDKLNSCCGRLQG